MKLSFNLEEKQGSLEIDAERLIDKKMETNKTKPQKRTKYQIKQETKLKKAEFKHKRDMQILLGMVIFLAVIFVIVFIGATLDDSSSDPPAPSTTAPTSDSTIHSQEDITTEASSLEEPTPLTIDNCPEFLELVENGIDTSESSATWSSFLESHCGDTLEFDGTISYWYDDLFFTGGVSFTIAIEDSEHMSLSWHNIALIELGMTGEYHYRKYYSGLIREGMRTHVIAEITQTDDGCTLELTSMQIIE